MTWEAIAVVMRVVTIWAAAMMSVRAVNNGARWGGGPEPVEIVSECLESSRNFEDA